MIQNELQRVVAEMNDELERCGIIVEIHSDDLCRWVKAIEAAQAVAPGGGDAPEWKQELHESLSDEYAAAPASEAKGQGQDDLCCPACEVTGFTMPIQHTEEMSFGRVIGLEADYCTNCGEAFVLPEKALRNEVKFNHARNHKPAASSVDDVMQSFDDTWADYARKFQADNTRFVEALPRKLAEQEQAGELPLLPFAQDVVLVEGGAGIDDHPYEATPANEYFTADQMRAYARDALLRRAARVEVTDAMVERLAKFIVSKESINCKTLDEAIFHQSNWRRAVSEAREMLIAALEPRE